MKAPLKTVSDVEYATMAWADWYNCDWPTSPSTRPLEFQWVWNTLPLSRHICNDANMYTLTIFLDFPDTFLSASATTENSTILWRELSQPQATLLASMAVLMSAAIAFIGPWLTHRRERQAARQTRYTTIAEQLASDHEPVRLAGAYALSALADEWQDNREYGQRDVAIEILCAYLRASPRRNLDKEVRGAIVSIIVEHTSTSPKNKWPSARINLSNAYLQYADMRGAVLEGAQLSNADLTEGKLSYATLRRCQLWGTMLNGASMGYCGLADTSLNGTKMRYASIPAANLSGSDLRDVDFTGTEIGMSLMNNITIVNSTLIRTEFHGANLEACTISGSDAEEAGFTVAILRKARLVETNFKKTVFQSATLTGATIKDCDFSQADLSGADLSDTDLIRVNLAGANLRGANLRGARIQLSPHNQCQFCAKPSDSNQKGIILVAWDEKTVWPEDFNIHHVIQRQQVELEGGSST